MESCVLQNVTVYSSVFSAACAIVGATLESAVNVPRSAANVSFFHVFPPNKNVLLYNKPLIFVLSFVAFCCTHHIFFTSIFQHA